MGFRGDEDNCPNLHHSLPYKRGSYIGIKPLKARCDVTKSEFIIPRLFFLCIEHSTHISYIEYDLGTLGVM